MMNNDGEGIKMNEHLKVDGRFSSQDVDRLLQMPLLADLTPAQGERIMNDVVPRRFRQGDIIFHEGDAGAVLYLVGSGQVRIFVNGVDGSETSVILFGRPGEMFGELAVIDGLPRSATAVAMEDTLLYTLSRTNFRYHMQRCPQFALNFMRELSLRVRYNTTQVDNLASLGVAQRLARKLVELGQKYGQAREDGVHIDMPLTQTDLATLIGATRESTNKHLRHFQEESWLYAEPGRLIICDPEALRAAGRP